MEIIRNNFEKYQDGVVALGVFDGIHRGHQKIVEETVKKAFEEKTKAYLFTFDPHPQTVVSPSYQIRQLTTISERAKLLEAKGINGLFVLSFTHEVLHLSPEDFIKRYLEEKLAVRHCCVGSDFAFGFNRKGNVELLEEYGNKIGFGVTIIDPIYAGEKPVKSSTIRKFLDHGKIEEANEMLGHFYSLTGLVVKGTGQGKGLGFPTANLKVHREKLVPQHGVYQGWASIGIKKYDAAISIGTRPTFTKNADETIEVYLIDFNKDIVGEEISVYLAKKLRDQIKFESAEDLKKQIGEDIAEILRC
jgi:riboflavin kinase/FMN adenylyltransferase